MTEPAHADPILALLPAERPAAFDRLPFEEQQWRGRVFLMILTGTGGKGLAYSWWQAMRQEDDDEATKAFVATVPDEQIIGGVIGMHQAAGTPAEA
jgi:hypothetical protein